jgi:hypothetical protein
MGKFIKILILLLIAVSSYSQTTIGEIRLMNQLHVSLTQEQDKNVLMYRDEKFTQITDFKTISLTTDEQVKLYDILIAKKEKGTAHNLTLQSGEVLNIEYRKSHVIIFHQEENGVSGFFRLTEKQINKLWGRKNI